MSKVANDIVAYHIAAIEEGSSPIGELSEALHILWFNSCHEERGMLEAIFKSLYDRAIMGHLSEIKEFPFPSDSAREIVLTKVRAIEAKEVSSPSDEITEVVGAWKKIGHGTDSFMRLLGDWLNEEVRKALPKLKEQPFVDPYGSA